jgi:LPS-assembly protein
MLTAWMACSTSVAWGAEAGSAASAPGAVIDSPAPLPPDRPLALQPSTVLGPPPTGDQARQRPMILRAETLRVRPELDAVADGDVEFRRAGTVIQADHFRYDSAEDLANARGQVLVTRDGVRYSGPELQLKVQRFEGFFLQPEFEFTRLGAGGRAERIDFIDSDRLRAERLIYTSCPRDSGAEPDWLLRADRVKLDFARNEGVAEGAVLQFLGLPILGLPVLSFPLSDDRKSGWLPPTVVPIDSRNGFTLAVPYYWNIAPNRDATLIPTLLSRRGLALDSEFRYLEAQHSGRVRLNWLPQDRSTGSQRYAWELDNAGKLLGGVGYTAHWRQVSDDAYWKDFPRSMPDSTVQRLLTQQLGAEREFNTGFGLLTPYARVQRWQVLQTGSGSDLIVAPYQRSPQLGLRLVPALGAGLRASLETEVNRFTRPDDSVSALLPTGWRWHALGAISRPFAPPGGWITPKLSFNAAAYQVDGFGTALPDRRAQRLIPTASLDAGLVFERQTHWFGRAQRQTLEPRLLYVNTPYREQASLPNFDSAERDFNTVSIYAENAFTGIDRVSDGQQVTTGVTTRLVDAESGAETLRLGVAQRIRLRDQRVVLSGAPLNQRFSDVLIEGASSVFNPWVIDAALQFNPDKSQVVRSIAGLRYTPAPLHTLSLRYRLAQGLSEQVELGWQWPVYHGKARPVGGAGGCGGTLYAVGRLNYSLKDGQATDSTVGMEYDTGCWIGRVVAERLSTGRAEATTRLLLQLELVGLSRLGANPLQVLKDNIPGYRLLREPGIAPFPTPEP